MKRDEVIRLLQAQRTHLLQQYGVQSLMLFGSVARDTATQSSDVDLLGKSVDLGTPKSLKPYIRERVAQEQVHVL